MSNSLQPHELQSIRLLCPSDFPGDNTGAGCHFLLQGSSWPRDRTQVSCIGRWIPYHWGSWEAHLTSYKAIKHIVKAIAFPAVMYRYERWTIKKAEHQRTDSFELWCWRRLLSPLYSKEIRSVNPKRNQPWILFWRTDAEAETPILWPPNAESTYWKRPWCWERLRAGGEGGEGVWDGWMASLTLWMRVWADSRGCAWCAAVHELQGVGHGRGTEQQQYSIKL